MNTRQVADALGCSIQHIRWLIKRGLLKAGKRKPRPNQTNQFGYEYTISKAEVDRLRRLPTDIAGRKRHGKNAKVKRHNVGR